ncbi:hypothetical protein PG997_003747 [Apiospora hydei]|uniref:Uncharacterized protein n=1 Tax=Apiospora hydei TaxID=1337664 RepID=A0ABR1X061_9PEZI
MQNILAVVLLAIAALEGVVAAPLASAAAIDVRTNEVPQTSPAFDGAEDIYGELFLQRTPLPDPSPVLLNEYADGGMGAPAPVADPTPLDSAPDLSGELGALPPRSADIEERDLAGGYDDQLEARDIDTEGSGGLEKRVGLPPLPIPCDDVL